MKKLVLPNYHFLVPCAKAFEAGKERGKTWPNDPDWNYRPGGPSVYSWKEGQKIAQTQQEYDCWHLGFSEGVKENPNLPEDHPARVNPFSE